MSEKTTVRDLEWKEMSRFRAAGLCFLLGLLCLLAGPAWVLKAKAAEVPE